MRITDPLKRSAGLQPQESFYPKKELFRTAASELGVQINLRDSYAPLLSVLFDLLDGALLPRPHNLELVEQKHRNPRCGDKLVDLGPATSVLGFGPAVD
jgi:hypothetical protein